MPVKSMVIRIARIKHFIVSHYIPYKKTNFFFKSSLNPSKIKGFDSYGFRDIL